MKLTPKQLQHAANIAKQIDDLERLRDVAEDTPVIVKIGGPTVARPLGDPRVEGVTDSSITVMVSANDIRMQLVNLLTPLYSELRNLGIDLQR